MAISKKSSFPLHLDVFKTFIVDDSPTSRYFKVTQLSDILSGGKNSFLIQGSTELKEGSYIFVEIKDSTGAIIYTEPAGGSPTNYYEGVSKPVSVHVYDDTPFGEATLTIVGELKNYDDNGIIRPIPDEWIGKINVKWQKKINVHPFLANTSPIRLYKRPNIEITETLLPIYERVNTQNIYTGYFRGVAIDPADGTNYPYNGPVKYEIVSINPTSASFTVPNNIPLADIPAVPFNKDSLNLPLNTNQLYLQTATTSSEYASPVSWSPIIKDIINPYRITVDVPYVTDRTNTESEKIRNIAYGTFQSAYESSTITVSDLSSSYASIRVSELDTFSGDIYRLKVFAKSRNDLKGYFLLEDIVLENNELLQTQFFEGDLNRRTGIFNQNIINTFWVSASLDDSGSAQYSQTDNLLNSVLLQPNTEIDNSNGIFKFYNKDEISFTKDFEYVLNYIPLFFKTTFSNKGLLDVYLSGSAFNDTISNSNYGKKIASLSGEEFKRFEKQTISFRADKSGNGNVVFVVRKGNWELSDISLKSATQTAFNPTELTFLTKPNIQIPSESFDFRFELFDVNYTYVPITLEKTIRFGGGNDIIPSINFNFNPSNGTAQNDAIFQISPTAVSSSPALIEITASLNLVTGPIVFNSSSATAYDRDGAVILPSDVVTGYPYPGLLTTLVNNNIGSAGPIKTTLTYANFSSKIKPNSGSGLPRFVDYIVYSAYQESSPTLINPPATFRIGADWTQFAGCTQGIITNITPTPDPLDFNNSVFYYITASNIDCISAPDSQFVTWFKPSGSTNWYWGGPLTGSGLTYISGSGPGGNPWVSCSNANGWYVKLENARNYNWIDFRVAKKCYGSIVIDNVTDPYTYRYISAPFIDSNRSSVRLNSYALNAGPTTGSVIQYSAGNFVNQTGNLIISSSNSNFQYAISASGPISYTTAPTPLLIPYSDYGRNITQNGRVLVRLKGGLTPDIYSGSLEAAAINETAVPKIINISGSVLQSGQIIVRYWVPNYGNDADFSPPYLGTDAQFRTDVYRKVSGSITNTITGNVFTDSRFYRPSGSAFNIVQLDPPIIAQPNDIYTFDTIKLAIYPTAAAYYAGFYWRITSTVPTRPYCSTYFFSPYHNNSGQQVGPCSDTIYYTVTGRGTGTTTTTTIETGSSFVPIEEVSFPDISVSQPGETVYINILATFANDSGNCSFIGGGYDTQSDWFSMPGCT